MRATRRGGRLKRKKKKIDKTLSPFEVPGGDDKKGRKRRRKNVNLKRANMRVVTKSRI